MVWQYIIPAAAAIGERLLGQHDAKKERQAQYDFAQQGVRWKAADAEAAGIHPLYALGAQTHSYSPVQVGGGYLSAMGQDVSRAYMATRTAEERRWEESQALERQRVLQNEERAYRDREEARRQRAFELDSQSAELRNQLLAIDVAKARATPNPPLPSGVSSAVRPGSVESRNLAGATPVAGSVSTVGRVKVNPAEIVSRDANDRSLTAGTTPGMTRYTIGGWDIELPGQQVSEALDSIPMGGLAAMAVNAYGKLKHGWNKPADSLLPKGYRWQWNFRAQSWEAVRSSSR